MQGIAQKMQESIKSLQDPAIQEFLLNHLNPNASKAIELFTLQIDYDREPLELKSNSSTDMPYELTLTYVFRFAPTAVCDAFADLISKQKVETQLELLHQHGEEVLNPAEHVFAALMKYAPTSARQKLTMLIMNWPDEWIENILTGKFSKKSKPDFDYFLNTLLNLEDPESARSILLALCKLEDNALLSILEKRTYSSDAPDALIDFLVKILTSDPVHEELILTILKRFEKFDPQKILMFFRGRGENKNLLHHILPIATPVIIKPLFKLFHYLTTKEQIMLLKDRANFPYHDEKFNIEPKHSFTPLDLVFDTKSAQPITPYIIQCLRENKSHFELLHTGSVKYFNSPVHTAAANHNLEACITYLETDKSTHLDHKNGKIINRKSILEVGQEAGFKTLTEFNTILPLYRFIQEPSNNPEKWLKNFEEKTKNEMHSIFALGWGEKKTLLHHAAIKGCQPALDFLLKKEIDINQEDDLGFTALELAINNQHWDCVKSLVENPTINLSKLLKNGQSALDVLLKHQNYDLIKTALQQLKNTSHDVWRNGLDIIAEYPIPKTSSLSKMLTKESINIEDHCNSEKDAATLFLHHTARDLSEDSESCFEILQEWITKKCKILSKNMDILEKDHTEAQLIIFLFSISPHILEKLIKRLLPNKQLEITIARALVSPWILSRITSDTLFRLHHILSSETLITLAKVHFSKSKLTKFPPVLLQEMAQILSLNTLTDCSSNRRDSSLYVLTIEKSIKELGFMHETTQTLLLELKKELSYFNNENWNEDNISAPFIELRHLTSLVKTDALKKSILQWVDEQEINAPILTRFDEIYCHQPEGFFGPSGSLLDDIMQKCAQNPNTILSNEHKSAFIWQLAHAKPKDVQLILKAHSQHFTQTQATQNLLGNVKSLDDQNRVYWFLNFALRTPNAHFVPLIDLTNTLIKELDTIGIQLNQSQLLSTLQQSLESLKCYLNKRHLNKNFNPENEPFNCTDMLSACENIRKMMKEVNNIKQLNHYNQLSQILTVIENNCPTLIEKTHENVENLQKDCFQTVETNLTQQDLPSVKQQLISAQNNHNVKHQEYFKSIAQLRKNPINNPESMTKLIIAGIHQHPDKAALLTPMLQWLHQHNQLSTLPHEYLCEILCLCTPQDWNALNLFLTETGEHYTKSSSARNALEALTHIQSTCTEKILCHTLADMNPATLHSLTIISRNAGAFELEQFINAAKTCKEKNIPLIDWLQQTPLPMDSEALSQWLDGGLAKIQRQEQDLMSIILTVKSIKLPNHNVKERLEQLTEHIRQQKSPVHTQAILYLAKIYSDVIQESPLSEECRLFVFNFAFLLSKTWLKTQMEVIRDLPEKIRLILLEHCLSGITSDEGTRRHACRHLLTSLIEFSSLHDEGMLTRIKTRLNQQDFELLGDEKLQELAKNILNKNTQNTQESTIDGVWIQRLLTSPEFIAQSTPQILEQLITRYRLISLALKQDEFDRLNNFLEKSLTFSQTDKENLSKVYREILENTEQKNALIGKRDRLLTFRCDDSIRALLNQLELNCLELKKQHPQLAEQALKNLYGHLNKQLSSLRKDWVFKISDFIYSQSRGSYGDLQKVRNTMSHWMDNWLYYRNFEQKELSNKQDLNIYNEQRNKIGFINEDEFAICLGEHAGNKLINFKEYPVGMPLYNDKRQKIGILEKSGKVQRENIFSKKTSARLLEKIPENELLQSPAALDLLIDDMLRAKTVDTLYQGENIKNNSQKRAWMNEQLNCRVMNNESCIAKESMQSLVKHQDNTSIFTLFENVSNQDNAFALFLTLCENDEKRTILLEEKTNLVEQCFKRFNATTFLKQYLINAHDKPWFAQGLKCFAAYAKKNQKPRLLTDALMHLGNMLGKDQILEKVPHDIMNALIATESTARVVLHDFLQDDGKKNIQESSTANIKGFTSLFVKSNLIPVLKKLNQQKDWTDSFQHRMLLHIFHSNHENIFNPKEYRYSQNLAWQDKDLSQAVIFLKRHMNMPKEIDQNQAITTKLITELTFRTANFGQRSLFYINHLEQNPQIDLNIINYQLEKTDSLTKTVQSFFLNMGTTLWTQFQTSFMPESNIREKNYKILEENKAIIDWGKLEKQTWALGEENTLSLMNAYLFNYTGTSTVLSALLNAVIATKDPAPLIKLFKDWGTILNAFPERDISAILFDTMEKTMVQHPDLLDDKILSDLAEYHWKVNLKHGDSNNEKMKNLKLIEHLGQQKHYALVSQACSLMAKQAANVPKNQLINSNTEQLKRIKLEADVEQRLVRHLNTWYFIFAQFFVRLWNGTRKNPSLTVKYCDNQAQYTSPLIIPDKITTPVESGQVISKNLRLLDNMPRLREMKSRLEVNKYSVNSERIQNMTIPDKRNRFMPPPQKNQHHEEHKIELELIN